MTGIAMNIAAECRHTNQPERAVKAGVQVCDGTGPEQCRTVYEGSCSTRYRSVSSGHLVRLTVLWCREREEGPPLAETACTRLPVEICGAGCTYRDGAQECHNKVHQ